MANSQEKGGGIILGRLDWSFAKSCHPASDPGAVVKGSTRTGRPDHAALCRRIGATFAFMLAVSLIAIKGCERLTQHHVWNTHLMRGCLSVVVGFATMVGLSFVAGQLLGPVKCRDGWMSSSIGRQGACSYHGGVDRSQNGLGIIFLIAGGVAGFAFYGSKIGERIDHRRQPPKSPSYTSPNPSPPPPSNPPSPQPIRVSQPTAPRLPKPITKPRPGAKACPRCGSAMKLRKARSGYYSGSKFWGCSRYPDCKGTANVKRRR